MKYVPPNYEIYYLVDDSCILDKEYRTCKFHSRTKLLFKVCCEKVQEFDDNAHLIGTNLLSSNCPFLHSSRGLFFGRWGGRVGSFNSSEMLLCSVLF